MSDRRKTLVEKHALKRLDRVENNKRKAYEKRPGGFPWKTIIMGLSFGIIFVLFILQIFFR